MKMTLPPSSNCRGRAVLEAFSSGLVSTSTDSLVVPMQSRNANNAECMTLQGSVLSLLGESLEEADAAVLDKKALSQADTASKLAGMGLLKAVRGCKEVLRLVRGLPPNRELERHRRNERTSRETERLTESTDG